MNIRRTLILSAMLGMGVSAQADTMTVVDRGADMRAVTDALELPGQAADEARNRAMNLATANEARELGLAFGEQQAAEHKPENPGAPAETPVSPELPDVAQRPDLPETPAEPELPGVAMLPELPEKPEVPASPELPELPDVPVAELPDLPEIPEKPEVPGVPELPDLPDVAADIIPDVAEQGLSRRP